MTKMSNAIKKLRREAIVITKAKGHFLDKPVKLTKTYALQACLNCGMGLELRSEPEEGESFMFGLALLLDCRSPSRCADCKEVVHPDVLKKNGGICGECKYSRQMLNHARRPYRDEGMDKWNERLWVDNEEIETPRNLSHMLPINEDDD